MANLVVHQLIGEPFANQLDEAVHQAVGVMLEDHLFAQVSAQAYRARLNDPQVASAWRQWPCMSRQLGIELNLR
ncbi:hypothetical protein D3C81_1870340 [compost metagenome]